MKKSIPRRIWDFLWHSDSLFSWLCCLVLAFVIVRFVFFPLAGLIFSSSLPFVIIESESLEHKLTHPCIEYDIRGTMCLKEDKSRYVICGESFEKKEKINFDRYWQLCGNWYEQRNISKGQFQDFRFTNGLYKGDIIVVKGSSSYSVGDIIVFRDRQPTPIIHRVVKDEEKIETKGDHNSAQLTYANSNNRVNELNISQEQIVGKAIARIPKIGWAKIFFVQLWRKLIR